MELIHFGAIRRFAPEMLRVPFANQVWSRELKAHGAVDADFSKPIRTPRGMPVVGSWQFFVNRSPELRRGLAEIFLAYPQSEFWEWIDRNRLLRLLEQRTFMTHALISLLGLVPPFLWAHGAAHAAPIELAT